MIRETGRVWSGAVITPRDGRMFVSITGHWKVPAVKLPTAPVENLQHDQIVCSSSTWIGLDGARSYLHSSLPQIGTAQNVIFKDGKLEPEYFAWYEWWCAGHVSRPNRGPSDVTLLPIKPGDSIQCTLTVATPTKVTFKMTKQSTTGDPVTFQITEPAPNLPPVEEAASPKIQRLISGATAQWITERPSDPNTRKPYDLANYGTVVFDNCSAIAAPNPASNDLLSRYPGDGDVTLRNMVRIRQNRAELISSAELRGRQSVATLYKGA